MKLTGKTLEDFNEWCYNEYGTDYYQIYHNTYLNALIIEWFDSISIYIVIDYYGKGVYTFHTYNEKGNDLVNIYRNDFSSRQEATEKAIIIANNIYNEQESQHS